jgi:hypothetical protein
MNGQLLTGSERSITHLLYDSRRIQQPFSSLFFALNQVETMAIVTCKRPMKKVSVLLS